MKTKSKILAGVLSAAMLLAAAVPGAVALLAQPKTPAGEPAQTIVPFATPDFGGIATAQKQVTASDKKYQITADEDALALVSDEKLLAVASYSTQRQITLLAQKNLDEVEVFPQNFHVVGDAGQVYEFEFDTPEDGEFVQLRVEAMLDEWRFYGEHAKITFTTPPEDPVDAAPQALNLYVSFGSNWFYKWTTYQSLKRNEYMRRRDFVTSVAKGATYTTKQRIATSLELSIEAGGEVYDKVSAKAGLKTKVEASYESGYTFNGPPESSKYNSREYGFEYYARNWAVQQDVTPTLAFWDKPKTYISSLIEPIKFKQYQVDSLAGPKQK